jgi:hypothetical protein
MLKQLGILILIILSAGAVSFLGFYLCLSPYNVEKACYNGPGDGQGQARLLNSSWQAGSSGNEIIVEYTTGKGGIAENGGIKISLGHILEIRGMRELYVPFDLSIWALVFFNMNPYREAAVSSSAPISQVELNIETPSKYKLLKDYFSLIKYKRSEIGKSSRDNLLRDIDRNIGLTVRVKKGSLKEGNVVTIELKNIKAPFRETAWDIVTSDDHDGDGLFGFINQMPRLDVKVNKTSGLFLSTPMNALSGQEIELLIAATGSPDSLKRVETYKATVKLFSDKPVPGLPESYKFIPEDRGVKRFRFKIPSSGIYKITAIDETGIAGRSNYIDTRPHKDFIFFGDMHVHSVISYFGEREPEYIFERKKDFEGLDFACLSDDDLAGVPPHTSINATLGMTQGEWEYIRKLSERFNRPGKFVTMLGYDWTSGKNGFRNIYFGPEVDNPPILYHAKDEYNSPLKLETALTGIDALIVDYSPALLTGRESHSWGPYTHRRRVIEIYNSDGSSEFYDNPFNVGRAWQDIPIKHKLFEWLIGYDLIQASSGSGSFVRDILAKGWKLGFTASSNEYYLAWINQTYKPGLTAVFSTTLERKSIYNSIKERSTYATTGVKIGLRFTCNNLTMGSAVKTTGAPLLYYEVLGTDKIKSVELIKFDGRYSVLSTNAPLGDTASFHFRDNTFRKKAFYYVRVTQADGNMAWSSPIWVEQEQ